MLFNSLEFFVFFILVFGVYWALPFKQQNIWLLFCSYLFYAFWDWRFCSLILLSTGIDYYCGQKIFSTDHKISRKKYLLISVILNLTFLCFFKYFNFFIHETEALLRTLGFTSTLPALTIILPVGISFYTFQSLSYTIDVYRRQLRPVNRFSDFALFVSFFPQLIAGPIERATHLLPQIQQGRRFRWNDFHEGFYLILWGLFEKLYVADRLGQIVDPIFQQSDRLIGKDVLLALYAFAFQIFCDFDAYSNIARGTAKWLGFDIMVNFRLPYFASNPKEFWQRWHISLSTWLRDYLYIPLGGNRWGSLKTLRNIMLVMFLGGLWHGAAWTFVLWGMYHGILICVYHANCKNISNNFFIRSLGWGVFFHLVVLGWLLFRAESIHQAAQMGSALLLGIHGPSFISGQWTAFLCAVLPLLVFQIWQWRKNDMFIVIHQHWLVQTFIFALLVYFIFAKGVLRAEEFIYFQF
ncbi:MAG: MBOAT family protein [Candidatus Omnitrophica bacterium]|nr:MBOAT family protein [Candidatus Omnitrophota bacterium]